MVNVLKFRTLFFSQIKCLVSRLEFTKCLPEYLTGKTLIRVCPFFQDLFLSYDVASGSEITPCNKICKPLVVYRFSGNVMTSIHNNVAYITKL